MTDPLPATTDEASLGEILGAALRSVAREPDDDHCDRLAARAQYQAALDLSDQLAGVFAVSSGEVFDALCSIPDNMLVLLESPEGWTALAGYVATDFGVPIVTYRPTIH
ncbi:hypothetical protein N0B51_09570 [Tsuneonella sp. YG55]|uniref:Uncharacterized protein n=1 Tax=Tsuneonella litorea TaxID=2976475 RepID=A0A9X3AN51_9SPHN|nr:hypothetical protein [Tsuneonella litorea]MCT2559232.1 hypothetical protein [Tsuneonella litorea]